MCHLQLRNNLQVLFNIQEIGIMARHQLLLNFQIQLLDICLRLSYQFKCQQQHKLATSNLYSFYHLKITALQEQSKNIHLQTLRVLSFLHLLELLSGEVSKN